MKQTADKTPTISLRLPMPMLKSLDKAAKASRRSRSFIVKEALDRHLGDIIEHEMKKPNTSFSNLLKYAGAGKGLGSPRTAEEIDQHIRWLRGDD